MYMTDLPLSSMAFKLENGQTLLISKEDVKNIAMQIIVEGSVNKAFVLLSEKDTTLERADRLYKIMREEKDMDADMKNWYLQQISDLLGCNEKRYVGSDGKDYELKNKETELATKS